MINCMSPILYAAACVAVTNLIPALEQSAFTSDLKGFAA